MSAFKSQLSVQMEAFLNYRDALGYSRKHNKVTLSSLDRFIVSEYPAADELTNEIVLKWFGAQTGNLSHKAAGVRLFAEYLKSIGYEAYVLPSRISTKKPSSKGIAAYLFTDEELSRLFNAIDSIPDNRYEPMFIELFPVMMRLTYTCGLRPNESRVLKRGRINFDTGTILIAETKHGKERIVVMSPDMLARCKEYDAKREPLSHGSEYFFPKWDGGVFEPNAIERCFRECWERANLGMDKEKLPSVRVYDLRHRFATTALIRWLDNDAELTAKLSYLQAYMGHGNLNETLYYVHFLPENLVKSSGIQWGDFNDIVPEVVTW